MRIPIHCVTGTSMGSIVGGTFAAGTPPARLEELVLTADWAEIFRDQPPRAEISMRRKVDDYKTLFAPEFGVKDGGLALPMGVIAGVSIEAFFRVLAEPAMGVTDFDKLPIPFRAMATDIETGQSVVLDRGSVAQAMRASMAVPGAIAPVEIDGRLLVDGGIANNLPIDEARRLCADVVIAVNISTPPLTRTQLTSALAIAGQLINFLGKQTVDDQLKSMGSGDVLIEPELGTISASSFTRSADAIRIGEEATRKLAPSLARYSLPPEQYAALRATQVAAGRSLGTVEEIRFEGLERTNPEVLRGLVESKPGEPLSEVKVGADLRRIYGRGDFESVSYRISGDGGPRAMVITPREKSWGPDYLRFGLGLESDFQGDSAFNLLVQYRRTWLNRLGGEWLTEAQVGQDTHLSTEFFQPLNEAGVWFGSVHGYVGQSTRGVFYGDDKIADYLVGSARAGIDAGAILGTLGMLRVGALWNQIDASVDVGDPVLPDVKQLSAGGRVSLAHRPARSRLVRSRRVLRHRLVLWRHEGPRLRLELPARRGQRELRPVVGTAHDEPLRLGGYGFRHRHAGLRFVHAGRTPAAVGIPPQPVRGPRIRVRSGDVLQPRPRDCRTSWARAYISAPRPRSDASPTATTDCRRRGRCIRDRCSWAPTRSPGRGTWAPGSATTAASASSCCSVRRERARRAADGQSANGRSVMGRRVFVAGVGMIPFAKPGASEPYNVMGAAATRAALADAGLGYDLIAAGLRRLRVRRLDQRPADALRGRDDGAAGRQRQQQLLDRLDGAVPGAAGDRRRRRRLRAGARLRADGARRPRDAFQRPPDAVRALRRRDRRAGRPARGSAGAALLRRRRHGPHGEIRDPDGDLRDDPRQGEPPCGEQSAGAVPQGGDDRRSDGVAGDDSRRDDPADGLSADLRRRRRRTGVRRISRAATGSMPRCGSTRRR